ncbi:geranylgeranyl diphosphate synthase [Microdochium trichocladiopsis]|uniref:Geranylgeranyl diphosphate synthase n=1 Tax=Microdochium trichocladiopsis TaxID=1682393 RepID=A0A9P8XQ62_9PEZI|nr:geranylgeranyl diphosphate synthase [Microdochium trichocladiopsis]KAH7010647.1 geranylgeranyl diphosphate synthase [Microdochium trichocladiopsis]
MVSENYAQETLGSPSTQPSSWDACRFATADFTVTSTAWPYGREKILLGPYNYLLSHPGKEIRSLILDAFNEWLKVPQESLDIIIKVVSTLHTASLLLDDIEDNSLLRRGQPVAHSIFGTPQTINSANYAYFLALRELKRLDNPKAHDIFVEEVINLHRGQGMDLFWRDTLHCPEEAEYLEMVGNKTGGLFRLAIKLMQAESTALLDCVPLAHLMGLIFQIADDYKNLFDITYTQGKGICEDLTEGKFSFPIIHSIRSDESNPLLLNILKQKTADVEVKRRAVKYMQGTGSFDYTKKVLDVLIDRSQKLADQLDNGRGQHAKILDTLNSRMIS